MERNVGLEVVKDILPADDARETVEVEVEVDRGNEDGTGVQALDELEARCPRYEPWEQQLQLLAIGRRNSARRGRDC